MPEIDFSESSVFPLLTLLHYLLINQIIPIKLSSAISKSIAYYWKTKFRPPLLVSICYYKINILPPT